MSAVPCPHCDKSVPKGTRICHHCLKDIRWSSVRRVFKRKDRPDPVPIQSPDRRFLWLLRLVYVMYGYTLITRTWELGESLAFLGPTAPMWTAYLLLPAVTLGLIIAGLACVRRDPFLWTLLLAGMHTAQLFQDAQSDSVSMGNHFVALALWTMTFAAPGLARRLKGEDKEKYAADDRSIVMQILIVYLGVLAVLAVNRFLFAEVELLPGFVRIIMFYTGISFVGLLAVWVDWPESWQASMRMGLSPRSLLLTLLALVFCLCLVYWMRGLNEGHWRPAQPTGWHTWPLSFLALVALAPALFEEILCRGILWQAVRQRAGTWGTILVTAALFAMLHLWAAGASGVLPAQFIAGLVLGWLRAKTDSLLPCMLCHAAYNATLYSLVVE